MDCLLCCSDIQASSSFARFVPDKHEGLTFAYPGLLGPEDKLHDLKIKGSIDISKLYEFIFRFDKHVNKSFKETTNKLDVITSHLGHRGQEVTNLEGSHDILQKEIEFLKIHLDERDE